MDEDKLDFIRRNPSAIMVTTRKNGSAHVARLTVGVVDGKVWASGTATRVRTKHLLQNPQAALAVFAQNGTGQWLGIEARVKMYEGRDGWDKTLELRRALGDVPENLDEFYQRLEEQQRLIYEFEPVRTYGRYK